MSFLFLFAICVSIRSGPLAWLMEDPAISSSTSSEAKKGDSSSTTSNSSSDAAAAESPVTGTGSQSASSSSSSSSSHALSPLPFGNGSGTGSGGHPCLVPCPLTDVDELLAMAQVCVLVCLLYCAHVYPLVRIPYSYIAVRLCVCFSFYLIMRLRDVQSPTCGIRLNVQLLSDSSRRVCGESIEISDRSRNTLKSTIVSPAILVCFQIVFRLHLRALFFTPSSSPHIYLFLFLVFGCSSFSRVLFFCLVLPRSNALLLLRSCKPTASSGRRSMS